MIFLSISNFVDSHIIWKLCWAWSACFCRWVIKENLVWSYVEKVIKFVILVDLSPSISCDEWWYSSNVGFTEIYEEQWQEGVSLIRGCFLCSQILSFWLSLLPIRQRSIKIMREVDPSNVKCCLESDSISGLGVCF